MVVDRLRQQNAPEAEKRLRDVFAASAISAVVTAARPTDKISAEAYWWGYKLFLPEPVMRDLNNPVGELHESGNRIGECRRRCLSGYRSICRCHHSIYRRRVRDYEEHRQREWCQAVRGLAFTDDLRSNAVVIFIFMVMV